MNKKPARKRRRPARTGSSKPVRSRSASPPAKIRLKTILVPIDFSPAALYPITWAKFIAQSTKANLHFVSVYAFPLPVARRFTPQRARDQAQEIEERIHSDLKAVALRQKVLKAAFHVRAGRPPSNICQLARRIQADLIVLSTHGRTGWERSLMGSTAEEVVRHAFCPVLVARQAKVGRKGRCGLRKIVVPVDFSECSTPGLNYAIGLAQRFGAELVLLHVLRVFNDLSPAMAYTRAEVTRWVRQDAKSHMAEVLRRTDFGETKFRTVIKIGAPAEKVCRYARRVSADLIVTATHGRTGLPHMLIGSTAEHIVRYARTPVLVVPTRARP